MALTEEQFDVLVKRLEELARQQPAMYRLRVALLAALGYVYIFSVLVLMLVFIAALVAMLIYGHPSGYLAVKVLELLAIPLVLIFVTVRSLFVYFPPPTGLKLKSQQVPRLFALINELTSALAAPKFHRILLTSDFNAGVVQRPRLGILGWQQNYLIVGLPLMQALSPEQFRAVLAHELGHLSGNHSRFAGWIYRVRKTWFQLLERVQKIRHKGSFIFENFFNWYAPFFSAYSFVLARMDEYEADRCAVQLAGVQNTAEALIAVAVRSQFLESQFWPSIYKQTEHQAEPPATAFTTMSRALLTNLKVEDATEWLEQALVQKTSNADTHPCLLDRLSALAFLSDPKQLSLPAAAEVSAAQQFLGNALEQLTAHFDRTWKEEIATPWRQRYAYAQEAQTNLQALEEKAQHQHLTTEDAWNRARLTAEFKSHEAAIPLLSELLTAQPDHESANYALGQMLLQKHDATGMEYLEKAMTAIPDNVISGCELIEFFLKQQGKTEEAKAYQRRAERHYGLVMRARQERSFVRASDRFQPHNLPESALHHLCQQLSRYDRVKEAYLVQKVLQYFPEQPFYVLGIKRKVAFLELSKSQHNRVLINQLVKELEFPNRAYIIILDSKMKNLEGKLRQVEGSVIYR